MKFFPAFATKYAGWISIYCSVSKVREESKMEYDTRKEARVWQRVQNEKAETNPLLQGDHLPALIMEQMQLSAIYLQLSRLLQGKDGAEFVRLAREARAQAVCVKGILVLINGQSPQIAHMPVQITTVDAVLRSCYGKELRLMKAYENRSGEAEYGPVFARLAQRGQAHCCALLELIGKIGKPK